MKSDVEYAADHRYRLLSGELAPSVTSITRLLDDGKSMGFAYAAVKLGPTFKEQWDEKADRGSRIHKHCEAWLEGEWVETLPDEQPYLDALEAFFGDYEVQPIAVERVVLSELGYGGRFDFVAELNGIPSLVDVKTGKPYATDHTLQLAAYRYSDGMAQYRDGALVAVEDLPPIRRTACLYLAATGLYELVEYPADRDAFAVFRQLLKVHRGLKGLRKEIRGAVRY